MAIRTPVLAANWKMNLGPEEVRSFARAFLTAAPRNDRTILIFPSALSFAAAHEAFASRTDIGLGVQNIATEPKGAFTGENSAPMAKEAGAQFVLVGHSERRHLFGESDDATAKKCALAFAHGLTPLLCVGEKLEEREAGDTEKVVLRQLRAGVSLLAPEQRSRILVAYEPVWAIGTGRTAQPTDASRVHAVIVGELGVLGADARVPILYGGGIL